MSCQPRDLGAPSKSLSTVPQSPPQPVSGSGCLSTQNTVIQLRDQLSKDSIHSFSYLVTEHMIATYTLNHKILIWLQNTNESILH